MRPAFGGFVAFSVYLPSYLKSAYDLTQSDAAFRTAGFVVIAVVMRPVGGWLSDRLHPVPVLIAGFAATTVLAAVAALEAPLMPVATFAFLGLAAALGAAAGACFALVAQVVPPGQVGATTGIVGAGGLGGFFRTPGHGRGPQRHRRLHPRLSVASSNSCRSDRLHLAGRPARRNTRRCLTS